MMPVPGVARGVELRADLGGLDEQVTGVEPDCPERGPGDLEGQLDGGAHVVGVDEQRGAGAERPHLGGEGLPLGVVEEGEGVGGGARRRDAVPAARLEVARGREPRDVGRSRRGHGRLLVGAPRPHLDDGPVTGRRRHPRRGRRDRRVVVEDRQGQRLEHDSLGEARLDDEDRRLREVAVTLGVAAHLAAEAVVGQEGDRGVVDDAVVGEEPQLIVAEAEVLQGVEEAAGPGDDAVAPPVGQASGEDLEDAPPVGLSRGEGGLEHRQLVVVGHQRGAHRGSLRASGTGGRDGERDA